MFRPARRPRTTPAPPAAPDPYTPFRYDPEDMTSFPSGHPVLPGHTTWLTLCEGGTVTVVTPGNRPPDPPRYRLADLPFGSWVLLEDGAGRPLPLALCADARGVQGRWLPIG